MRELLNWKESRYRDYGVVCLLILITVISFWGVHANGFVEHDDPVYITENVHVTTGLTRANIVWAFCDARWGDSGFWHPLTWMSHMLDCQLFGLNPTGHHLMSLFIHVCNTLLLFFALRKMTGAFWCSGFVAACFAVHPLHVESVAWAAGRKDLLSAFFWFLSLLAYAWYVDKRESWRRYALFVGVFLLELLTKTALTILPLVLLVVDYWPLQRWQNEKWTGLIREKIPLFLLAGIAMGIALLAGHGGFMQTFPLSVRVGYSFVSYAGYIGKMLWPTNLASYYTHPGLTLSLGKVLVSVLLLATICTWSIVNARRFPYVLSGWLWYGIILFPVCGFVQIVTHGMADRYAYISLVGLFIAVAWGAKDVVQRWPLTKVGMGILAATVLLACMVVTRMQVKHWKDTESLAERTWMVNPRDAEWHNGMGEALARQKHFEEAIVYYRKAWHMGSPYGSLYVRIYRNCAYALMEVGQLDEAVAMYRRLLEIQPDNANIHNDMGIVLRRQGKIAEAIAQYSEALRINPSLQLARTNMELALGRQAAGSIGGKKEEEMFTSGVTFSRQGRYAEAVDCFMEVLRNRPGFAEAHYNLGIVFSQQGKLKAAESHLSEAVRLQPSLTQAKKALEALQQEMDKSNGTKGH